MGWKEWLFGATPPQRPIPPPSTYRPPASRPRAQPPPVPTAPRPTLKTIDVPGSRDRNTVGTHHFESAVDALPIGPVKVTLRSKPNDANPHAIGAFVGNRQIGWLSTDWSASDPHVGWVKRLESGGIRPRFEGECEMRSAGKYVLFFMPRDDELDDVADRLLGHPQ